LYLGGQPIETYHKIIDEFNVSWLPTLRTMWSPKGQQVM